ncbi:MAG: S-layer homology domain-containing protein [Clostridia bacterium]|nr:S-layer homology domain-containing protein [Clostridia bacterium]
MKKLLSLILSLTLLASVFVFTAFAADGQEVGDGYISFDASALKIDNVSGKLNSRVESGVTFEGKTAVKITPTPNTAESAILAMDCHRIASYGAKVEIPKYKYVGVTYYYDTDNPTYNGKLMFRYLAGNTKATGDVVRESTQNIVANEWTEAFFNFSDVNLSANAVQNHLQQVHFRPFGTKNPAELSSDDVFYVAKYTFYEKNPDPNAKTTLAFYKNNPDVFGDGEKIFSLKSGDSFTLPSPDIYTYEKTEFLGWLCTYDNKKYQAGEAITVGEANLTFNAIWSKEDTTGEYLAKSFADFQGGVVNNVDTATLEKVEKDGRNALLIVPNPAATGGVRIAVDSFWNGAGVNLDVYRWAVVEYLYESPNPAQNVQMFISPMKLGNVLTVDRFSALSTEPIVEGSWANALFDLSGIGEVLNPDTGDHMMRQLHLRPFAEYPVKELTVNDKMYIGKITFFREKPTFETHTAYMNGYNDGTFKPSGTMTRAEACTVVARLLEKEENIAGTSTFTDVPADQWFAKYIGFCEAKGLLKSYSGEFTPDKPITRAEFFELVYLTALAKDQGIVKTFKDVDASHPKYTSIMAAASAGLVAGYAEADGTLTFKPDNTITRAEVVTVINRAKGISKKMADISSNMVVLFMDVDTSHWAFADIAEATVQHVEDGGKWLYASVDPVAMLSQKVDISAIYDIAEGKKQIEILDLREEQRKDEIRSTPNMDLSAISGKKIYVSSSEGNDKNDGLTEATPVKTITRANTLVGSNGAVLLKRGDHWREPFAAKTGTTYTAYGEGAKPTLYASPENGADPSKWFLVHEDASTGALVWQYANLNLRDVGTIVLNEGEGFTMKEIPSCEGEKFIVRGDRQKKVFDYKEQLNKNFEHFHAANSSVSGGVINIDAARGPLYLRCDNGNPGKIFDSIEFNVKNHIITVAGDNVTIDNLCLKYTGAHGISSGNVKNLKVTNCEIGWIGGSIQGYNALGGTDGAATRYGNGVEVYGSCDGYYINNCYIYQCYDAGVTHQLSKRTLTGNYREDNIEYSNNLITDCVYSIEYFLGAPENDASIIREGKNVLFKENLLRRAGFGFGSIRPDTGNQRHIRSGGPSSQDRFVNFRIENNIFDRAIQELVDTSSEYKTYAPDYEGNTYIQGVGNKLYTHSVSDRGNMDISAPFAIKNVLGDETAKVYYVDYIPVYSFSYTTDKKAEVTEEDRKVPEVKLETESAESTEILAPLLVRTTKSKTLYGSIRSSYTVDVQTDEKTGIIYSHINILNDSAVLNMDCYLPKYSIETPSVYFKVLMRTNKVAQPHVIVYSMADADGNRVGNGANATTAGLTTGNGDWEEVIIKVSNFPTGAVSSTQIHLMFAGQGIKGESFYKDGKLVDNAYFDIAAWAAFSNLASAEKYDLVAAAK